MSEWAWVALGYGVTVFTVAIYLISLTRRWARLRRKVGERS